MTFERRYEILVIDDDPRIGRLFTDILREENCAVYSTSSGDEAIELSRSINFDLLFLDMILPEIDGVNVLKKLKEINKNIQVVVMTGCPALGKLEEVSKIGVVRTLIKPFHIDQIRKIIEKLKDGDAKSLEQNKYHALLIDDRNMIRIEFFKLLEELDFYIEEISTIAEVRGVAEDLKFDLIMINDSTWLGGDAESISLIKNQVPVVKRFYMIDEKTDREEIKKDLEVSFGKESESSRSVTVSAQ